MGFYSASAAEKKRISTNGEFVEATIQHPMKKKRSYKVWTKKNPSVRWVRLLGLKLDPRIYHPLSSGDRLY
jgi:hypothetical protein